MKKKLLLISMAAALVLSACGAQLPEMTDEQAKAVGEYAAITLLKHDANSRSRLVDLSKVVSPPILEPTVPAEEEAQLPAEPEPDVPKTPVIEIGAETAGAESMEEYLELPAGVMVVFAGSEVCQSYSSENYLTLETTPGKSLLVLKFQINNASGADLALDMLRRRDVYRVTVNETYSRTALTTMLANDMTTYAGVLADGTGTELVVLIEIEAEQADNVHSISLNLKNESQSYTVQLM